MDHKYSYSYSFSYNSYSFDPYQNSGKVGTHSLHAESKIVDGIWEGLIGWPNQLLIREKNRKGTGKT